MKAIKSWTRKRASDYRSGESLNGSLLLLAGLALLLGVASEAKAFSFGAIQVQSGFGDRFKAEIELNVEGDDVEVALGDREDYQRLDLQRQLIMNDLLIKKPLESRGGRKILHVVSLKPLFFPSFTLVVRATQYGGTILKMYLITVDFRQSLALNVQGGKKKTSQAAEPVDLLKEDAGSSGNRDEQVSEKMTSDSGEKAGGSAHATEDVAPEMKIAPASLARPPTATISSNTRKRMHSGAIWVAPRAARGLRVTPLPVPQDEEPPEVAEQGEAKPLTPDSDSKADDDPKIESQTPVDLAHAGENRDSSDSNPDSETSPAASDNNTTDDSLPTTETEAKSAENASGEVKESAEGANETGDYLKEGESLFDFAKRVAPNDADAARVTVALWMDNQNKFINGNMNWIREGTRLNLGNLENRLADLDRHQSNKILWSQWQEWKLIREKRLSPVMAEANEMIEEEPSPSEMIFERVKIFEIFQGWKKSWEDGDFDNHMAYYSQPSENDENHSLRELRSRKKRLFDRHKNVKINALPAVLVFRGGRMWVSFNQAFSSDKMKSFGRKDIEVVQEGNQWKMADETFRVREYKEKGPDLPLDSSAASDPKVGQRRYLDAPYVIHASSHLDYTAATRANNLLRKRGFDSYTSPVELPGGKSIFRVYIGRFTDWELTQEIALQVRGIDAGRDAIPVHLPYTLQLGVYDTEKEAVERVQSMRAQGFSAFVYTSSEHNFLHPTFRVFLGAFDSRQSAEQLFLKLSALNIVSSLKTP